MNRDNPAYKRWRRFMRENLPENEHYMTYTMVPNRGFYIAFPNKNWGHFLEDAADREEANQWIPLSLYGHLRRKYKKDKQWLLSSSTSKPQKPASGS